MGCGLVVRGARTGCHTRRGWLGMGGLRWG